MCVCVRSLLYGVLEANGQVEYALFSQNMRMVIQEWREYRSKFDFLLLDRQVTESWHCPEWTDAYVPLTIRKEDIHIKRKNNN